MGLCVARSHFRWLAFPSGFLALFMRFPLRFIMRCFSSATWTVNFELSPSTLASNRLESQRVAEKAERTEVEK